MSDQDTTPLVATEPQPTTDMAEEVHPVPGETSSVKRDSLKGDSSRTEEDPGPGEASGSPGPTSPKRRLSCPVYFGVRSYLHNFYDKNASFKDPTLYEDDDDPYFTHANSRVHSNRRCPPIWWKIFMWVGVLLLLLGVVGILVGYLVPPRAVVVGEDQAAGEWYIDISAKNFNVGLDACKLIGLGLFCIGGITLALSLLFPSFLHYCHDDDHGDDLCKVPLRGSEVGEVRGPLSPLEMSIPVSSKVRNVQPGGKAPQSMLSTAPYKE